MMEKLANGSFISEELLKAKYIGSEPNIKQVRLMCQHIHAMETDGSIENVNNHTYRVEVKNQTTIETDSYVEALGVFNAL